MMLKVVLSTAVVLLLAVSIQCYDLPFATRIETGFEYPLATDGSSESNQLFWDLPTDKRMSDVQVNLQFTSSDGSDVDVDVFVRRYAPFEPDHDSDYWVSQCLKSQVYPNGFNPYDCEMETFTTGGKSVLASNLTLDVPRTGRYFMLVLPLELKKNQNVTYKLLVEPHQCNNPLGGANCGGVVETLEFDGPQSDPIGGTIEHDGDWKYYQFSVEPGVAEIQVSTGNANADDADGAFYLRFGNVPVFCNITKAVENANEGRPVWSNLPCSTDWYFKTGFNLNWQNPYAGNYYVGVQGDEGFEFEFTITKVVCEDGTNGAYCTSGRIMNECNTANAKTCESVDTALTEEDFGEVLEIEVVANRWSYAHFELGDNLYELSVTAQIEDYKKSYDLAMVLNPGGVPENNAESGDAAFKLDELYLIGGEIDDSKAHTISTYYAAGNAGYFYIGFFAPSDDDDRSFTVSYQVEKQDCPGDNDSCDENGECDTYLSACSCDESAKNMITCSTKADSSPSPDSSSSPGGLGWGSIVALSICIPLAIIIVIGIIAGGAYYLKFKGGYETIQ